MKQSPISYAAALNINKSKASSSAPLCNIHEEGLICPDGEDCIYVHGDFCEFCSKFSLHPYNEQLRKLHNSVKIQ
jgi:hypothetical protein